MNVALPGAPDRIFGGYVFDLDGTVYLGDALLPGAADAVARLRGAGSRAVFLTNNPTSLPADYAAKLTRLGIPAAPPEVVSSTDALLGYLARHAQGARLLAVAEPLLVELLRSNGFEVTDAPDHADVVVVSFDRTFDYAKFTARRPTAASPTVARSSPRSRSRPGPGPRRSWASRRSTWPRPSSSASD